MLKTVPKAIVRADNIYSPYLTHQEQSGYSRLMNDFMQLCEQHNGSERANDDCVHALILAESFMRSVANHHPDHPYTANEMEQLFYRQTLGRFERHDETPPDFNSLLGRVAAKFNARALNLGQEQDLDGLLGILEQGGAVVVHHPQSVFVKTDKSRAAIEAGDKMTGLDINRPAPKFAEVIVALQSIGIFANQMIIHSGIVSPQMVRDAPYIILQIPELDCEIAVCDRIGEVILVNRPLVGPHLFTMYDKKELVGAFGMKRVEYRGDWPTELLGHILGDAPADKSQRARVDTQKFANTQTNKPSRLTPEMLLIAMLDYAQQQFEITKTWGLPTVYTTDPVPGMESENWRALNTNGQKGCRGLEKGMTLPEIQQLYGLKAGRKLIPEAIAGAVKNWKEHGILPKEIEVKPLTVERILGAMLDYAHQQFEKTGKWVLPTEDTTDPVLGMVGETWKSLNKNGHNGGRGLAKGMTLPEIQRVYGLKTGLRTVIPDEIEVAVWNWKKHGLLPHKKTDKPTENSLSLPSFPQP